MTPAPAERSGEAGPADHPERNGMSPMAQFAAKTVVVTLAFVIGGWIILDQIFDRMNSALEHRTEQLRQQLSSVLKTNVGGPALWVALQRMLDNAADPRNEPDPEVKRKILADIQILANRWRPIVLEGAAIIAGDGAAGPAGAHSEPAAESGPRRP